VRVASPSTISNVHFVLLYDVSHSHSHVDYVAGSEFR